MAVSLRARSIYRVLHPLIVATDIANQETIRMPAANGPHTDKLPPLAFYRIEQPYALLQVAKAVERFVAEHGNPPARIGLAYEVISAYWNALYSRVYFYRRANGSLIAVDLYGMDIPNNIVYCTSK